MSEEIPEWALDRAHGLCRSESGIATPTYNTTYPVRALARYIAAHEQPPVDPDVLAVREILEAYRGFGSGLISRGDCDGLGIFQAALAAYRKHKEAGK